MAPASRYRAALVLVCGLLGGCSQVVLYTDELVDGGTGRSGLVTLPATAGGFAGFAIGIPADILAIPVTFPLYRAQRSQNKLKADPISTLLFPSFVLWRAGRLIAIPFDIAEFMIYRAWQPPLTPTREEQKALEYEVDESTWHCYAVETIYPPPPESAGQ